MSNYPAGVRDSDFNYRECPDCGRNPGDGTGHSETCGYQGMTDHEIDRDIEADKADDRYHERKVEQYEEEVSE